MHSENELKPQQGVEKACVCSGRIKRRCFACTEKTGCGG